MHERIARMVRNRKRELAEWVTRQQFFNKPELEAKWGAAGMTKCTEDNQYHFSYLAEAIHFEYPEFFTDYLAWAKSLLHSLHIPETDLRDNIALVGPAIETIISPEARNLAQPILARAIQALPKLPSEVESFLDPGAPHYELAQHWFNSLLSHNARDARLSILKAVENGVSVLDIYEHVLTPTLYEVGRLWQQRVINEGEEHFFSQNTDTVLALLTAYAEPNRTKQCVLGFCVADEGHEIGIRLLMDCFSMHGWNAVTLGSNVPTRNIEKLLLTWQPDVVAISVTMTYHLTEVEAVIAAIRAVQLPKPPIILVGGRPFRICPDLRTRIGADVSAQNCTEALAGVGRLLAA